MLYEIAVVELPKKSAKKDDEDGQQNVERLVFGPQAIVAKDEQGVAMAVFLDHADKFKDVDRHRLQVYIRPFA